MKFMNPYLRFAAFISALLLTASLGQAMQRDPVLFAEPPGLEPDIQFWIRIYSEVESRRGLLHDSRHIHVVYEEVDLPDGLSEADREKYLDRKKDRYRKILKALGKGDRENLDSEERRVLALFPPDISNKELRAYAQRLRFQLGQADRFQAGLVRSGAYTDHIRETLEEMGLPAQLAVLPHVESSFTPDAYSRVGASGLWQFTRATGGRFMRVDQIVDERRDPYIATTAAASLLSQNLRATGSWPLAITAYNHGASGVRRATRKLGHRDIERIVRDYRSRRFGFASRNFYVEFLAASRIVEKPELYFGPLPTDSPIQFETHALPAYISAEALSHALQVDLASLKSANPSLLSPIWKGQKRIPRGFEFKVPAAELDQPLAKTLASLPKSELFARQTRDSYHIVRRGESLSLIAQRYRVPIRELASLNNLRDRNRIRVGQKLRLPIEHASGRGTIKDEIAPLPDDGRYSVRSGDSLAEIALRFGIDEQELARTNGIRNRDRIYIGQVLQFPYPPGMLPSLSSSSSPGAIAAKAPAKSAGKTEAKPIPGPSIPPINLLADPSDYLVAKDNTIEVQFGETLGHYAEWLDIRAQRLRALNGLGFGAALPIHSRLALDFSRVSPSLFEKQRSDYQRDVQERYFSEQEIVGTVTHKLERGDSIWVLAHQRFNIPLWLLQQYNPDVDFETASAGTELIAPLLRKHGLPDTP